MNVALVVALAAYAVILLWLGFRRREGFGSWHMFTKISQCHYELETEDGVAINVWDHVPHSQLSMNRQFVERLLLYLRVVHGIHARGRVHLLEGFDTTVLRVEDGDVVG